MLHTFTVRPPIRTEPCCEERRQNHRYSACVSLATANVSGGYSLLQFVWFFFQQTETSTVFSNVVDIFSSDEAVITHLLFSIHCLPQHIYKNIRDSLSFQSRNLGLVMFFMTWLQQMSFYSKFNLLCWFIPQNFDLFSIDLKLKWNRRRYFHYIYYIILHVFLVVALILFWTQGLTTESDIMIWYLIWWKISSLR